MFIDYILSKLIFYFYLILSRKYVIKRKYVYDPFCYLFKPHCDSEMENTKSAIPVHFLVLCHRLIPLILSLLFYFYVAENQGQSSVSSVWSAFLFFILCGKFPYHKLWIFERSKRIVWVIYQGLHKPIGFTHTKYFSPYGDSCMKSEVI